MRSLDFERNQITDLTPLTNLKNLTSLRLTQNPKLTRPQIDELQKALPNCVIDSDLATSSEQIIARIRNDIKKPSGELTAEDMAKVENLGLGKNRLTDLSPLKGAVNLQGLDLLDNQVRDLTPLSGLKTVSYTHLTLPTICSV